MGHMHSVACRDCKLEGIVAGTVDAPTNTTYLMAGRWHCGYCPQCDELSGVAYDNAPMLPAPQATPRSFFIGLKHKLFGEYQATHDGEPNRLLPEQIEAFRCYTCKTPLREWLHSMPCPRCSGVMLHISGSDCLAD